MVIITPHKKSGWFRVSSIILHLGRLQLDFPATSCQGKLVFATGERGLPSLNRGYRTPDPSLSRLPKCPLATERCVMG